MPGPCLPHNYLFPVPGRFLLFGVSKGSWVLETDPSLPRPPQGGAPLRDVPRLPSTPLSTLQTLRHLQQMLREIRPSLPLDKQLRGHKQPQLVHMLYL